MFRWVIALCVLAACSSQHGASPSTLDSPRAAAQASPAPAHAGTGQGHGRHHHEDRHDRPISPPHLVLDVVVGGVTTTWHKDVFDRVPKLPGKNRAGEDREVWSLRALARQIGPSARVTAVTGASGRMTITPGAWADPSHTPILHTTRRGTLKFRWTDASGTWGDAAVKDVTRLDVAR